MTNKRSEYKHLLDENDALRLELALIKHRLACSERIRKENATYMQELWDDNQRVHAELRYFNQVT